MHLSKQASTSQSPFFLFLRDDEQYWKRRAITEGLTRQVFSAMSESEGASMISRNSSDQAHHCTVHTNACCDGILLIVSGPGTLLGSSLRDIPRPALYRLLRSCAPRCAAVLHGHRHQLRVLSRVEASCLVLQHDDVCYRSKTFRLRHRGSTPTATSVSHTPPVPFANDDHRIKTTTI